MTQFEGAQLGLCKSEVHTRAGRRQKVEDKFQPTAKPRFLGLGNVSRRRNRDETSRPACAKEVKIAFAVAPTHNAAILRREPLGEEGA